MAINMNSGFALCIHLAGLPQVEGANIYQLNSQSLYFHVSFEIELRLIKRVYELRECLRARAERESAPRN